MKHRRMARLGAVMAVVVLSLTVGLATPVVAQGPASSQVQPIDWSNLLQVTLQDMLAAALPNAAKGREGDQLTDPNSPPAMPSGAPSPHPRAPAGGRS